MRYDSLTEFVAEMIPRAKNGVILCSQAEHDNYVMLLRDSGRPDSPTLEGNRLKVI